MEYQRYQMEKTSECVKIGAHLMPCTSALQLFPRLLFQPITFTLHVHAVKQCNIFDSCVFSVATFQMQPPLPRCSACGDTHELL